MDYSKLINDNGMYLYQDDNFNTISLQLTFLSSGDKKEEIIRDLLCNYMIKSNKKYTSSENEINRRKRELYSLELMFAPQRIGSKDHIVLYADMISPKVVNDDYLKDAFEFIRNIILYPDFTNEGILEYVKKSYLVDLAYKLSDINKKAKRLYYVNTFDDAKDKYSYSIDMDFITDIVNSITLEDLERVYHETFNEDSFYRGIVFGNISLDEFKLFRNFFPFNSDKEDLDYSKDNNIIEKDVEIVDENTNESIVYVTYKIDHLSEEVLSLLSGILNYGNGLCYKILREKYGLVYSSSAIFFQYSDALTFKAKIDKKNKQKLLEAIDEMVSIIKDKEKLKDLLKFIKYYFKNDYALISEKKNDMFDELDDYVRGINKGYNKFIENIDSYTEDDIIRYTKSLRKASVFMYKGGSNE